MRVNGLKLLLAALLLAAAALPALPLYGAEAEAGKGTIIFENYTAEAVDVQLDGYYAATVAPQTRLTLRNVPAGKHVLFGQSVSEKWPSTPIVLKAGRSYTWRIK